MKEIPYLSPKTHQTTFEIDLKALVSNLNYYKSTLKPETKIIVMVKAFAYGLGLSKISEVLANQNIDYLAVAYTDEAVELRKAGYEGKLMVFNPELECFDNIIQYNIEPEIYNLSLLKGFLEHVKNNAAYQLIKPFKVHIKIDTGMHRLGFMPYELEEAATLIVESKALKIETVFSHLAAADDPTEDEFTQQQVEAFEKGFEKFSSYFDYPILKHISNSAAIERFPDLQMDLVRLGIGLYGYSPQPEIAQKLKNVCSLKSRIAEIKLLEPGHTVGYGRKGVVTKPSKIALVFLGYADGLPRSLSNKGELYLNGKMAKIIGNVCMDITMLDVTDIDCQVGDAVEVFGENFSLEKFSEMIGTIPYEVLTDISSRVRRVYKN